MRKVLIITPYFAPRAEVGSLRPLKLVRHLPAHGWTPVVLCLPVGAGQVDQSLWSSIPPDLVVSRTYATGPLWWIEPRRGQIPEEEDGEWLVVRSWPRRMADRAWEVVDDLTLLDRRLPNAPQAVASALDLVRDHGIDAILACGDPWSSLVVGATAARIAGLPHVVDMRSPWTLDRRRMRVKPAPIRYVERVLERRVVSTAARVVLNTRAARDAYRDAHADVEPGRFTFVRSSFDPDLFEKPEARDEPRQTDLVRILHFGRFRRFRTSGNVARILDMLWRDHPEVARRVRLDIVGGVEGRDRDLLAGEGVRIRVLPAVPHARSLDLLRRADLLLLTQERDHTLEIPAKLYDYLAADRPVLALSDSDEIARILEETGCGKCLRSFEVATAARRVADLVEGRWTHSPDREAISRHTSPEMARAMAAVLSESVPG